MSVRVPPQAKRRIFAVPALIALASIGGLLLGLTGDGVRDIAAWALLALPILAIAWRPPKTRFLDNRTRS